MICLRQMVLNEYKRSWMPSGLNVSYNNWDLWENQFSLQNKNLIYTKEIM